MIFWLLERFLLVTASVGIDVVVAGRGSVCMSNLSFRANEFSFV